MRGRPRAADRTEALEAAMRAFWADGYEGASIDRLSREMRMPRATLYGDFGDKQQLFLAAVEHYARTRLACVTAALDGGGELGDDLAGFFDAVVALATSEPDARGCLISCVLADAAGASTAFRDELSSRYAGMEARIEARLRHAGWDTAAEVPARDAAALIAAIARGIMLKARAGASVGTLRPLAAAAVRAVLAIGPENPGAKGAET
jgi:TetR/AcrR family transcriptional repressor of nem operon